MHATLLRALTFALLAAAACAAMLLVGGAHGDDPPSREAAAHFSEKIEPILRAHCYQCHSGESDELQGGLRLDSQPGWRRGGDSGEPALVPGDADKSLLIQAVRHAGREMPPDKKLSDEEIAVLVAWVKAGAADPRGEEPAAKPREVWWSLRPLVRPELPQLPSREPEQADSSWHSHPVDRFILAKLHEQGLSPTGRADRRTLIRRLSFDLLGLPPTAEEVAAFVGDANPQAYDKLVERLLDSPRYGERWARHWLDVVHFGETHGYDKDQPRPHAWPYRDYVIKAFNEDKPYARFVQEQIAGDVLFAGTRDGIEAMGFIAAGPWDFIGHAEVPESKIDGKIARHLDRDDMVSTTINTFCSTTVHCAQCHNHKFDPITQEDYYSLQAVFAALDRADKRYDLDPQVARRRAELETRERERMAALDERKLAIATAGGAELTDLDAKIAAAQSASSPGRRPEYGWHSAISPKQDEVKWVQVDLGRSVEIDKIVLAPCWDDFNGIGAGFGFPVRFRVEISDNAEFGDESTVIASHEEEDFSRPGTKPQDFSAKGRTARYVRVTATKLAPRMNDFIFALAELTVLDAAGQNAAAGAAVMSLDSIEAPPRWSQRNLTDGIYPAAAEGGESLEELRRLREELIAKVTTPEMRDATAAAEQALAEARAELATLPAPLTVYAGTIHSGGGTFSGTGPFGGKPREITVLKRGDVTKPGPPVGPGTLACVSALPARFELPADAPEGERRAALARWLTDERNPLTWRSIVNRVWQYHFGRGLVETPNDFGKMGALPSHRELLDWLAVEFRDGGGSLKQLHKLIVTSEAYCQRSDVENTAAAEFDAENRLLWRMNRRRLEAEAVRDSVLAAAGKLDLTMGGPSFQDFVVERPEHSPHYEYHLADPEDPRLHRRSIYRFIVRSQQQPWMAAMDCADPSILVDRRNETITPLAALAQLNNALMLAMARHFAARVEPTGDPAQQIAAAFRIALQREPSGEEVEAIVAYRNAHGLENACRLVLNLNEFAFVD